MARATLYDLLGISPSALPHEIHQAYRRHALRLHPDRNQNPTATEEFNKLVEAYKVLSDPKRRQVYDTLLVIIQAQQSERVLNIYVTPASGTGKATNPEHAPVKHPAAKKSRFRAKANKTTIRHAKPRRFHERAGRQHWRRKAQPESFREKYGGVIMVLATALILACGLWVFRRYYIVLERVTNLSDRGYTRWPEQLYNQQVVRTLYLDNNEISSVPDEAASDDMLLILDLSHNKLTTFPAALCGLPNLRKLSLAGNSLSVLPPGIVCMNRLRILDLSGNQLKTLPPEIRTMGSHLSQLDVSANPLVPGMADSLRKWLPGVQVTASPKR